MNKVWIILGIIFMSAACTKENFIDTGKASGVYDGSVMEYLRSHTQDWDSTVAVIEWAGLTDLFEGNDSEYPEITFFGPTNLSVMRYMYNKNIERVKDVEPEVWREMLLKHVIKGKFMKSDFSKGDRTEGGDVFATLGVNQLRVYYQTSPYGEVPDAGPVSLYIDPVGGYSVTQIASADIEPKNGAVHSLVYSFTFGDL